MGKTLEMACKQLLQGRGVFIWVRRWLALLCNHMRRTEWHIWFCHVAWILTVSPRKKKCNGQGKHQDSLLWRRCSSHGWNTKYVTGSVTGIKMPWLWNELLMFVYRKIHYWFPVIQSQGAVSMKTDGYATKTVIFYCVFGIRVGTENITKTLTPCMHEGCAKTSVQWLLSNWCVE